MYPWWCPIGAGAIPLFWADHWGFLWYRILPEIWWLPSQFQDVMSWSSSRLLGSFVPRGGPPMPRRWLDIGVMIPGTYQAAMAFLSLTPCQFWPCSGSFCLIYFTCHKIYSSTISLLLAAGRSEAPYLQPFSTGNSSTISYCTKLLYHTHALDSWKSPAALPAGLLVLCRAGQLWQWWGLHYERRGAHQTWLPGKSLLNGALNGNKQR